MSGQEEVPFQPVSAKKGKRPASSPAHAMSSVNSDLIIEGLWAKMEKRFAEMMSELSAKFDSLVQPFQDRLNAIEGELTQNRRVLEAQDLFLTRVREREVQSGRVERLNNIRLYGLKIIQDLDPKLEPISAAKIFVQERFGKDIADKIVQAKRPHPKDKKFRVVAVFDTPETAAAVMKIKSEAGMKDVTKDMSDYHLELRQQLYKHMKTFQARGEMAEMRSDHIWALKTVWTSSVSGLLVKRNEVFSGGLGSEVRAGETYASVVTSPRRSRSTSPSCMD
jgi:hypothetical protein